MGDLDSKEDYLVAMRETVDAYIWLDQVASALGIRMTHKSWWGVNIKKRREKVLNKIVKLKGS